MNTLWLAWLSILKLCAFLLYFSNLLSCWQFGKLIIWQSGVFQSVGLGWLGGSGLATLQGPGLPHPAFSRSRSSRSRSSIDILPSSNGPQSSVEQAFRWRMWLWLWSHRFLVIASLAGEVSHLLEEFTIELTIMPGSTHILLLCFFRCDSISL